MLCLISSGQDDGKWYPVKVEAQRRAGKRKIKHKLVYEGGDTEWLDFQAEGKDKVHWRALEEPTSTSTGKKKGAKRKSVPPKAAKAGKKAKAKSAASATGAKGVKRKRASGAGSSDAAGSECSTAARAFARRSPSTRRARSGGSASRTTRSDGCA